MERRAIFADVGAARIWSGAYDETYDGETYKPGILLSDDPVSGAELRPAASPGVDVYISGVPSLRTDAESGDEFELHVCRETPAGAWGKIGGYWGIISAVEGPLEALRIDTLPPLERATKITRPRWSHEDYSSRYPGDNFFRDLAEIQQNRIRINFP